MLRTIRNRVNKKKKPVNHCLTVPNVTKDGETGGKMEVVIKKKKNNDHKYLVLFTGFSVTSKLGSKTLLLRAFLLRYQVRVLIRQ